MLMRLPSRWTARTDPSQAPPATASCHRYRLGDGQWAHRCQARRPGRELNSSNRGPDMLSEPWLVRITIATKGQLVHCNQLPDSS